MASYFELKKQISTKTPSSGGRVSYFNLKKQVAPVIQSNATLEAQRARDMRRQEAEAKAAEFRQQAVDISRPTSILKDAAKTIGRGALGLAKEVVRTPLTVPLKVVQTAAEGITGRPQVYQPESPVGKFFYGEGPRQSLQQDQRAIQKFAQERGAGFKTAAGLGALGAGAEAVADLALPGFGKAITRKVAPTVARKLFKETPDAAVSATRVELKRGELAPIVKQVEEKTGKLKISQINEVKAKAERGLTPEEIADDIITPKAQKSPVSDVTKKVDEVPVKPVVPVKKQAPDLTKEINKADYEDILKKKIEETPAPKKGEVTVIQTGSGKYVDTQIDEAIGRGITKDTKVFNVKQDNLKLTDNQEKNLRGERLLEKQVQQAEAKAIKKDVETPKVTTTSTIGTSGLAKSVKSKAIKDKMIYGFDKRFRELPDYDKRIHKEKAVKATDYVLNDYDNAVKVAMGEIKPPKGLVPEDVYVALNLHATNTKDIEMLRRLATESRLIGEATEMGQRISTLQQLAPNSTLSRIKEVSKERIKRAEKRTGKSISKAKREVTKEIKSKIKQKVPTKDTWNKFISEITCKTNG